MTLTWLFMRLGVGLTYNFNVEEMWLAASQTEWDDGSSFQEKKPKTRSFCSDFCGQFRDYCAISPASVKDHSSTSSGLHPSVWNQHLEISPKGRNFIPPDKSTLPPTRWEQNPKLFSSHRCSGYFSLQMSPPQTAGCGNFNLWRASTLQPGLPTRQRLNWRHWWSQTLLARSLNFSHVASVL